MASLQKATDTNLDITVVIATYGRPGGAFNVVKQIRKIYPEVEIIVVDQLSSSQITEAEIKQFKIKYINLDKPNLSVARNVGWRQANSSWVLFLDDDVEITPKLISKHAQYLNQSEVVGVTGRVINDNDILPEDLAVSTGQSDFMKLKFSYHFWSNRSQKIDFLYGCNMSCRKKTLELVNGFDQYFQKIFDDIDIGWRLKKYGHLVFEPEALVYHHQAVSGGSRYQLQQKQNDLYRNYGYFIAKSVIFPLSVISLCLRARSAIFKGWTELGSLLKGYSDFYIKK